MKSKLIAVILIVLSLFSCKEENKRAPILTEKKEFKITDSTLIFPEEKHFKSLKQITFGGDNAEAYWSFNDSMLVFQSNFKNWNVSCDQMFLMQANETFKNTIPPMVSTGNGRTTCAYFLPDNKHIIYASTHCRRQRLSRYTFT